MFSCRQHEVFDQSCRVVKYLTAKVHAVSVSIPTHTFVGPLQMQFLEKFARTPYTSSEEYSQCDGMASSSEEITYKSEV